MSGPLFLMTDPGHFGVFYRINPWMQPERWDQDPAATRLAAARASHELRRVLGELGAGIEILPSAKGVPDLVFPANAAVVLDAKVLLARFKNRERKAEEPLFLRAFMALKARGLVEQVIELPANVLQEGAGDCIWDAARGHFWAGFGQRSDARSLDVIEQVFGKKVMGLELASQRFYHLDTCFCVLSGGEILYYPPAFTEDALSQIGIHVAPEKRIEASDAEAAAFSVNAVALGRDLVMAKAPASLSRKLTQRGYRLHQVDLAPFLLSGGGAYCMTLRLDLKSGRPAQMRAAE